MFRDISLVSELRKQVHHSYVCEDIVSKSPLMHRIFETLPAIALSRSTVVIEGESGTGKELVARAVHRLSNRAGDFVPVNVAGLDDHVFADTLFGHKKGAFTDATRDQTGVFETAHGGTILLDEVGGH